MAENIIIISSDDDSDFGYESSDAYNSDKCGSTFEEPGDYYEEMAEINEVKVL